MPMPNYVKIACRILLDLTLGLLLFLLVVGMMPARAQTTLALPIDEPMIGICHPYDAVVETLGRLFHETGTGPTMVEQSKSAVEVFISPVAPAGLGTLTVVEIFPDQTTCYRVFNSSQAVSGAGWGAKPQMAGKGM